MLGGVASGYYVQSSGHTAVKWFGDGAGGTSSKGISVLVRFWPELCRDFFQPCSLVTDVQGSCGSRCSCEKLDGTSHPVRIPSDSLKMNIVTMIPGNDAVTSVASPARADSELVGAVGDPGRCDWSSHNCWFG